MANIDQAQGALLTVTALLREQYWPSTEMATFRFGRVTDRIFKPSEELVDGDGKTLQIITGRTDSARMNRNAYADFGNQRPFQATSIKFRFSSDSTASDFTRLEAVAELPHLELQRAAGRPEVAENIAREVDMQTRQNVQDSFAIAVHANANGRVALVNGAAVQNDDQDYSSASALSGGETSFRVKIDGGPLAPFEPGTVWDFYSAAGVLQADECRVTDKNPDDNSIGFELTSSSTVANVDNVADNAEIFRSGERGNGYRGSLTEWFETPSSGENFIGGKDRTTAANRYLLPMRTRVGSSSAQINKQFLDDLSLKMGYVFEEGQSVPLILGHTSVIQTLREDIGEDALTTESPDNSGEYNFGEMAVSYMHPHWGKVRLVGDAMAPTDTLKFLDLSTWIRLKYGFRGFDFLPGDIGPWYRKQADAGNGKSVFYRMEGYTIDGIFCTQPRKNAAIMNITA